VKIFPFLAAYVALGAVTGSAYGQEQMPSADAEAGSPVVGPGTGLPSTAARAAAELKAEERQRILGVVPEFNTSNIQDAAPLSAAQKFQLALKGEIDPFAFVAAGLYAGFSQWQKESPEYGYGASGYAKRFSASYLDAFDGAMIGDAALPILLHQDPRYFRQGSGPFASRLIHAVASSYRCKADDGTWTWNYSNLLGNLAAGAIANVYYPASDRGAAPTFERALTVTAEGAAGAVFFEFWPDISRKFLTHRKKAQS
jgi:hypothetical protein